MWGKKHQPLNIESNMKSALLQKHLFVQLASSCTLTSKGIPWEISHIWYILKALIQSPVIKTVSSNYIKSRVLFIE